MQFSLVKFLLSTVAVTSVAGVVVPIERRKDFYTTHEEHGHLPGGRNPPPTAILNQVMRVFKGENPADILNSYNKKSDKENGARFGRETNENAGVLASLGLSDIPFIGKMI